MLRFGSFARRLIHTATKYGGSKMIVRGSEWCTSKQCGKCGHLHDTSDTYDCPMCDVVIDRDVNGARNILLKFLI